MTLSRKILFRNAALVLGLLLLSAVCLMGLNWLRGDVAVALDEYADLRAVEKVELQASSAKATLANDPLLSDPQSITADLQEAREELRQFIRNQQSPRGLRETEYDLREQRQGTRAMERLGDALDAIRHSPPDPLRANAAILSSLGELNRMAHDMDRTIQFTQASATHAVRRTMLLVGVLSAAIAVGALAVSILQYLSIVAPLRRLRQGVASVASGKFSHRLAPGGDTEYRELAGDFNRMAAELESFYQQLEQKVAVKSKQLALSERLASVGFLAAGVAHEINNPLSIISGYAELCAKRLGHAADPETARTLHIIRDEAFRCKKITSKLLALARGGSDQRETLSMPHLAEDVAELIVGLDRYNDRRVVLKFDSGQELDVIGNATELKQVLLNLTINGLEAVPSATGEVVLEARRRNGSVDLIVRDNGRGMAPEILEHVFEPFFTEKRGASEPGTGLGLSITHAIVEAHGGDIRAESDGPGQGSRFTVTLPAAQVFHKEHA